MRHIGRVLKRRLFVGESLGALQCPPKGLPPVLAINQKWRASDDVRSGGEVACPPLLAQRDARLSFRGLSCGDQPSRSAHDDASE